MCMIFICWLSNGYMMYIGYGSWCVLIVDEWLMNVWTNRCYFIYYERAPDLLDDYWISIKPLCLNMHSWPVHYMFAICLTKWLSWLGQVFGLCLVECIFHHEINDFGKCHWVLGNGLEADLEIRLIIQDHILWNEIFGLQSLRCRLMHVVGGSQLYECLSMGLVERLMHVVGGSQLYEFLSMGLVEGSYQKKWCPTHFLSTWGGYSTSEWPIDPVWCVELLVCFLWLAPLLNGT